MILGYLKTVSVKYQTICLFLTKFLAKFKTKLRLKTEIVKIADLYANSFIPIPKKIFLIPMNEEKSSKEEKEKVEVKTEEAVKVPIKIGKKIMMHREHNHREHNMHREHMYNEHKTIRHAAGQAIVRGLEFATTFTKESIKFAKKFVYVHAPVARNAKEKISASISKGVKKVQEFGENLQAGG